MVNLISKIQEKRMNKGRRKYGNFNPLIDQRIFALEMLHEVIDALNYYDMALQAQQDLPCKRLLRLALRFCAYLLIIHLQKRGIKNEAIT